MKVRIEVNPDGEEEILIRCRQLTPQILKIEELVQNGGPPGAEAMELTLGDRSFIVPTREILFFESESGKTAAHTRDRMFYTEQPLYEVAERLPHFFARVSKSCILNIDAVASLHREVTGVCEVSLRGCTKKVFVSRMYYKPFREMLTERMYHENSR